jgi:hypothetical protein
VDDIDSIRQFLQPPRDDRVMELKRAHPAEEAIWNSKSSTG